MTLPGTVSRDYPLRDRHFKLGTTSFIFPDHILPNVEKLGLVFDEIELLVFESRPALPSKSDIDRLLTLSRNLDLSYNIHLPTDVDLTCRSLEKREAAVDTFLHVIDLFAAVTPTTHTLHLEMPAHIKTDPGSQNRLKIWEEDTRQGLEALLSCIPDPGLLSVETLDYPFAFVETLVEEFHLSVCIDAGHGIKYGHDFSTTFEKHQFRTPIIHLHGVDFSKNPAKDHTALDVLSTTHVEKVCTVLEHFTGVVSLEVFNLENLNRSLTFLSRLFKDIPLPLSTT